MNGVPLFQKEGNEMGPTGTTSAFPQETWSTAWNLLLRKIVREVVGKG
jgi:hypothetical protein